MNLLIDVQNAAGQCLVPEDKEFLLWARTTLEYPVLEWRRDHAFSMQDIRGQGVQLTVRLVGEQESEALNLRYRHQQGPTNILSFPFDQPFMLEPPLLGDLVVCAPLVEQEAQAQGKASTAHWTHLVVHGLMHLLGYDHVNAEAAEEMESLEVRIMQQLGLPDPYRQEDTLANHS